MGGRQTPNNQGDIFDHMFVVYEFPDDARGFVGQRPILAQIIRRHEPGRLTPQCVARLGIAAPYFPNGTPTVALITQRSSGAP